MGPVGVDGPWSTLPMTAPVSPPSAATPSLDPAAVRDDAFTGVSPEQERQCLVDLIQRTRNGLLLYPALWLVLMQTDGYMRRHTTFVLIHLLILLTLMVMRLIHHRVMVHDDVSRIALNRRMFRAWSVIYNLYWGVLCAIVQVEPDAPDLRWIMLLTTVGITAGGAVVVSIDRVLPRVYPVLTLLPTVLAVLPQGDTTAWVISGLTLVMALYAFGLSSMVGKDYWARMRTQALLELRARELEDLSRTDALTQVPNRLGFQERLDVAWRDARRRGESLGVAMVDLDHFKRINDTHGHPFGDDCLRAAAQSLCEAVRRPADLVARFGGEEFIVLMPNTDLAGAQAVAERMLARVRATVLQQSGVDVALSCSIGVAATAAVPGQGPDQLIQWADRALYQAKQAGRARVECLATTLSAAEMGA